MTEHAAHALGVAGSHVGLAVRRRVRVEGFFSRMWFMKAWRRRSLPVPVTLKRLAAPRWVFIFGIGLLLGGGGGGGLRLRLRL